MPDKFEQIRNVAQLGSSMTVGYTVGKIVEAAVPGNIGKIGMIATTIGSSLISGILTDACVDRLEEKFDEIKKKSEELKEKLAEKNKKAEEA